MANLPSRGSKGRLVHSMSSFWHVTFIKGLFRGNIYHVLFETGIPRRLKQHTTHRLWGLFLCRMYSIILQQEKEKPLATNRSFQFISGTKLMIYRQLKCTYLQNSLKKERHWILKLFYWAGENSSKKTCIFALMITLKRAEGTLL